MNMNCRFKILFNFLMIAVSFIAFSQKDSSRSNFEVLPILSYDSDVGFGYGAKVFLYDQLNSNESFDFILFNSTKGERWYKFVFSIPDFEARQGTKYPFAIDIVLEYDKFNKYNYFYTTSFWYFDKTSLWNYYPPNSNVYEDFCNYEKLNIGLFYSKAYLKDFTATYAVQFKSFRLYNFIPDPDLDSSLFWNRNELVRYISLMLNIRWDTRKSLINPKSGLVAKLETEFAPNFNFNDLAFLRALISFNYYKEIFKDYLLFALRTSVEAVIASEKESYFKYIHIGGNNTVRGIPMDKYCSDVVLLVNNELRFPIWWRFGGVAGIDIAIANKVEDSYFLNQEDWLIGSVIGLRFFMDNFIVRADLGISKESKGFYLNFGHMF